jgi:hypothetical protein
VGGLESSGRTLAVLPELILPVFFYTTGSG